MTDHGARRRAAAVELIREKGWDGVIYATSANFQYLLDWNEYHWQRECMNNINGQSCSALLPEALLWLSREGEYRVCMTPIAATRAPWEPNVVLSYMDQFEDTCSRFVKGKKIGVGYNCRAFLETMVGEILPGAEVEDAEPLLWELRAVKDEKEIGILRANALFTDRAIQHVVTCLHEGMTNWEAEQALMDYGFACGIPDMSFPPTIGFKTRMTESAREPRTFSREDRLTPGTGIALDIGFLNHGYCSDWGRTLYWGKAPDYVREGYLALEAGQVHMIESIVPGKTNINQLYGYVMEEAARRGYGDRMCFPDTGSLGHQIGIDCHEHPMLNNSVDYILKPGMVFCSEPKMFFVNECYMRVEDMVLVTETGAVSLSQFPRDLFEVGGV